jgi:hypothetical protein
MNLVSILAHARSEVARELAKPTGERSSGADDASLAAVAAELQRYEEAVERGARPLDRGMWRLVTDTWDDQSDLARLVVEAEQAAVQREPGRQDRHWCERQRSERVVADDED